MLDRHDIFLFASESSAIIVQRMSSHNFKKMQKNTLAFRHEDVIYYKSRC